MKTLRHIMMALLLMATYIVPAWAQKNMVVVTTEGDIKAFPANQVDGIEYDQKTDSYTLFVGTQRITYAAETLHNISYDDQYLVDMDSYIVPEDDATINPNLIIPGQENTNIIELDTARYCATVEFKQDVPKLYVGSILMLQNDTIVVPCYVLTHQVSGKTARLTFRYAELGEVLYNQTIVIGEDENGETVVRTEAKNVRRASGKSLLAALKDAFTFSLVGVTASVDMSMNVKPTYVEELTAPYGTGREKRAKAYYKKVVANGLINLDANINIKVGGGFESSKELRFKGLQKSSLVMVGYVPLWITVKVQPVSRAEVKSSAALTYTYNFKGTVNLTATTEYNGFLDEWSKPVFDFAVDNQHEKPYYFGSEGETGVNVYPVYPELSVEIYHTVGVALAIRPYLSLKHQAVLKAGVPYSASSISLELDARGEIYKQNMFLAGSRKTLLEFGPFSLYSKDLWKSPAKVKDLGVGTTVNITPFAKRKTHIILAEDSVILGYRDTTSVTYQLYDYDYIAEDYKTTANANTSIEQQWFSDMPWDHRFPRAEDSTLVAQGLYPVGDRINLKVPEDGKIRAHIDCPAPGGFRRVLLTRILDGNDKVINQTMREVGDEIKNFNATYRMRYGGETVTGTVEYRDGGASIKNVIPTPEATVIFNYSGGLSTITVAGVTVPYKSLPPMAFNLARPELKEFDKMYYSKINGYNNHPDITAVGRGEVIGLPCKTITVGNVVTYYIWHNLCLKMDGGDTEGCILSLEVLDE